MGVGKRIVHAWIITTIPAAAAIAAFSYHYKNNIRIVDISTLTATMLYGVLVYTFMLSSSSFIFSIIFLRKANATIVVPTNVADQ
jgi:hypothetical protein